MSEAAKKIDGPLLVELNADDLRAIVQQGKPRTQKATAADLVWVVCYQVGRLCWEVDLCPALAPALEF